MSYLLLAGEFNRTACHATASCGSRIEPDQGVELIIASVTQPKVPDFHAIEALREFRAFGRHQ